MSLTEGDKFRNSSAIAQWNFTSKVMTDALKKNLFEQEQQIAEDIGDVDEPFDPESLKGGTPEFKSINEKMKELARLLPGLKIYFNEDNRTVSTLMGSVNELISDYYFISRYDGAGGEKVGRQLLKDTKGRLDAFAKEKDKDKIFVDALDDALDVWTRGKKKVIGFFASENIIVSPDDYDKKLVAFGKILPNLKDGSRTFDPPVLGGVGGERIPLPHKKSIFSSLYFYNKLPSISKPFNFPLQQYYLFNRINIFKEDKNSVPTKAMISTTAAEGVKFVLKVNNLIVDLNTSFKSFVGLTGSMSDEELKNINDEIIKINKQVEEWSDKLFYLETDGEFFPNIVVPRAGKDIELNVKRMSKAMHILRNDSFETFTGSYGDTFKKLKQQRNF